MNKKKTKRIKLFDKKFLHKCMEPNYFNSTEKLCKAKKRLRKLVKKYNRQDLLFYLKYDMISRGILIVCARSLLNGR